MGFRRLTLLLRLPLAVFLCSLLVCLGGNLPPEDYLAVPEKVADAFDERDDNKPFDVGLQIVIFEDDLIQHSNWVSLDLGNGPQGVTLELHATGPPIV